MRQRDLCREWPQKAQKHKKSGTMRNDQGMAKACGLCVIRSGRRPSTCMDIFATGISRRVTKNSFCDFCAFCGEPAFLTKSHPILKKAEHHVCRQNDLPRREFCKTFGEALLSLLQPLRGPSPSSWPFVEMFLPFRPSWISAPPSPTPGKPLRSPTNALVALRRPSRWITLLRRGADPFVDNSFPLPAQMRISLEGV